jgi:RimJ/RimL family protein N-acetyltransferase
MKFDLITERLILRPPSQNDVNELFELMSEKNLTTFLTWESHKNIETTRNVIQGLIDSQKEGNSYHWCICHGEQIIGLVSLIDVRRRIRTWTLNRAELSYWIGSNYQRKGFATEASRAVVELGFDNLELHKIIIAHVTENMESLSICNKLGFIKYAHEHDAFFKNEKWYDLIWYELIN